MRRVPGCASGVRSKEVAVPPDHALRRASIAWIRRSRRLLCTFGAVFGRRRLALAVAGQNFNVELGATVFHQRQAAESDALRRPGGAPRHGQQQCGRAVQRKIHFSHSHIVVSGEQDKRLQRCSQHGVYAAAIDTLMFKASETIGLPALQTAPTQ